MKTLLCHTAQAGRAAEAAAVQEVPGLTTHKHHALQELPSLTEHM